MKKILVSLLLLLTTGFFANAQKITVESVDLRVGSMFSKNAGTVFGTGAGVSIGLFDRNFQFAPSVDYNFGASRLLNVNAELKYNFDLGSGFAVFPMAGASWNHAKADWLGDALNVGKLRESRFGFNGGVGVSYKPLTIRAFYNTGVKMFGVSAGYSIKLRKNR